MIVLHGHKLIFLKARKVAGTSFEIALSRYAGEGDIVTPISPKDEEIRVRLGFTQGQNYKRPLAELMSRVNARDVKYMRKLRWPLKFYNHMPAHEAKSRLGDAIWQTYTKLSIVRNPFDYMVSAYFWENKDRRPDFQQWCLDHPHIFGRNNEQYLINGQPIIDFFIRYENLKEDILRFEESMPSLAGLYDTFQSINAKGEARPRTGPSVQELFVGADRVKELVCQRSRFEIEKFGYNLVS